MFIVKACKGKGHPVTCHCRHSGEIQVQLYPFSTKALEGVVEWLFWQTTVLRSSVHRASKLLHLKLYRYAGVKKIWEADCVVGVWLCIWFYKSQYAGEVNPQLTYFANETWFYVNGHILVGTQNNRQCSAHNPNLTHERLLYDSKVGVCCGISAKSIVRFIFLDTINLEGYI